MKVVKSLPTPLIFAIYPSYKGKKCYRAVFETYLDTKPLGICGNDF